VPDHSLPRKTCRRDPKIFGLPSHVAFGIAALGEQAAVTSDGNEYDRAEVEMAREGYLILDSDLHMMEPDDLWAR
jgi:hypothetical protein